MKRAALSDRIAEIVGPRWVEVDTAALEHNVRQVLGLLRPGTELMAVVKSDAYGLGAVETARAAVAAGASWLGVTTVEEGLELRRHGLTAPILVFAPPLEAEAPACLAYGLTPTVTHRDVAEYLARAARSLGIAAPVHLKVETGLGRLGLEPAAAVELAREMAAWPEIFLEGVYTHLATAGLNSAFVLRQAKAFEAVLVGLEDVGIRPRYRHICNSAAIVNHPDLHYDMVRAGNLLYAQVSGRVRDRLGLRDPWQVRARILQVRDVPKGEPVGYGADFRTSRASTLAVIPLGFADGLGIVPARSPRRFGELARAVTKLVLSGLGFYRGHYTVEVNGRAVPLVGRVAMQMAIADVTGIPGVRSGDEVGAPALRRVNTGARLPRLYTRDGVPYRARTLAGEITFDEWLGAEG